MRWDYKINLNGVISQMNDKYDLSCHEKRCPKEVKSVIAAEIAKAPPLAGFVPGVKACKTIAELNRKLSVIWDKADSARVWCGFPA
jgi:hypothetical protein